MQGYQSVLINAQGDGTALTNSTTATSILPGQAKGTLPPGFVDVIGKALRIRAQGRISTLATTPGTLTIDIRFGSVIVFNSGALVLSATAKTNVTWELEVDLVARTVGASTVATLMGIGRLTSEALGSTTVAGEAKTSLLPVSAPAVGTGFDSTAAQIVDLFATWSVANASNSIQAHTYTLTSLN